ncbi:MAG: hypothetical protein ACI31G_02555 [Bacilli bacterium]
MNKIKKLTLKLKEQIYEEPLVKEYFRLKQLIENDEQISLLKKQIAKSKKEKNDIEYNRLMELYNDNPLIKNFSSVENEVYALLNQIKESLDA